MPDERVDQTSRGRSLTFYRGGDAQSLEEDGMMSPPDIPDEVLTTMDVTPLLTGSSAKVLFKGDGLDGFSLVRAWFGPGFKLPRHSHSADCLYHVLSGEARMGSRVLEPGDGFLVRADQPYSYEAGPDGLEVLEFRGKTSFDMRILDRTVERWRPIIEAASGASR